MLNDFLKRPSGCLLALIGLSISAAAYGAGQPSAQTGLMTFPNASVVNQPAAPAPQQAAPKGGMKAFKDPVTGKLTAPSTEQAAELEAAGKAHGPSRKPLSASQSAPIYPAQGGVGMTLDESQDSYFLAHKDADGKLVEECVPDQAAAMKALQAKRHANNKSALKGEQK